MRIKNLDELKSQIRPYLRKYLEEKGIKTTGAHFCCPNAKVHKNKDNTPSAGFFPDTDHWNCLVCEGAGDIFHAAYYLENKPLSSYEFIADNVLYLAKKFNLQYEVLEETPEEKRKKQIYDLLELVVKYTYLYLQKYNTEKVLSYVKSRGWSDLRKSFFLGYSPSKSLYAFLKQHSISDELIESSGIDVIKKGNSIFIPIVENRLIIPWRNEYGKVSALVSRALDGETKPKYLFTKNSIVHKKSQALFNLREARKYSNELYAVESNASVLTLFANGVHNVIALSGKDLTTEQYDILVRRGVEKITLCLDSDDVGITNTEKIIELYRNKTDLKFLVKELPRMSAEEDKNFKDPDDFVKKYGIEKFKNLPEIDAFIWTLNRVPFNSDNTEILLSDKNKDILFSIIACEKDDLKRERLVEKFCDKTKFTKTAVTKELQNIFKDNQNIISVKDIIESRESLVRDIDEFEEKVWSRTGELLGLDTGWPNFNRITDGLQEGFYIVGGRTNIGKSAWLMSLSKNILEHNRDKVYVLYFSIDDSKYKSIGRMISMQCGIPINWIKNPKYKIKMNEALTEEKKTELLQARDKAINYIKALTTSFAFRANNKIEEMVNMIRVYQRIAENDKKRLVVIVDKIHNLDTYKKLQIREKIDFISVSLKKCVNEFNIPIIGSLEVVKSSIMERPTESHIKETQKLEDDSDMTILLYNEYKIEPDTVYVFTEDQKTYPIVEAIIPKNKLNDVSGYDVRLFYRFYPHLGLLKECTDEEQSRYRNAK